MYQAGTVTKAPTRADENAPQVATDALNAEDQQIVRLLANNWNQSQIAEMLGVNRSVVSRRMKHIREVFAQSLNQASFAVAYA